MSNKPKAKAKAIETQLRATASDQLAEEIERELQIPDPDADDKSVEQALRAAYKSHKSHENTGNE